MPETETEIRHHAESFLATPEQQPAWPPHLEPEIASRQEVITIPMTGIDAILADWRALLQLSLDDNPFMSPAFLIPAASHLAKNDGLSLAAIWEHTNSLRRLVGLFALMPATRNRATGWLSASRAALWHHPLQAFCAPLLAGPEPLAQRTMQTFLDWLSARRPRLANLETMAMPVDGLATRLLEAEATRRGLVIEHRRERAHTHGLDFKPKLAAADLKAITLATAPGDVRRALELLLCLDAEEHGSDVRASILGYPDHATFIRAAVRSFSLENRIMIALLDRADAKAGAIILEGRDKAYLWWTMGPSACDPRIEAALAGAAQRQIGKVLVAAALRPLTGLGTETLVTQSLSIKLAAFGQAATAS